MGERKNDNVGASFAAWSFAVKMQKFAWSLWFESRRLTDEEVLAGPSARLDSDMRGQGSQAQDCN